MLPINLISEVLPTYASKPRPVLILNAARLKFFLLETATLNRATHRPRTGPEMATWAVELAKCGLEQGREFALPSWYIKAAVQGALSQLPNPQRYNRWFQDHVAKSLRLTDTYFLTKFQQCERHLGYYGRHNSSEPLRPSVALELGTGWFPIIPIGLALSGVETVYSVDIQSLLSRETVRVTLEMYAKAQARGQVTVLRADAPERIKTVLRMGERASEKDFLAHLGIVLLIADARHLSLDTGSIDLICSNNTLGHIPRAVIVEILRQFHRIVTERGIMSHHIDLADQYAKFDRGITVYNFLKFSDPVWKIFNNDLQYQNRLRLPDFRELHAEAGFEILEESNRSQPLKVLKQVTLASRFERYKAEELAVHDTWIVSRPKVRAGAAR